jgi:predicted dehydrogenase
MRRVLIIGAGGIGGRHIRGYAATGRAEISVVEPDPTRRKAAADLPEIDATFADLAAANPATFDLAVICAPANLHVDLMRDCARADLPFMVEKPLSVTPAGVDTVLAQVAARNLLARVGYIRRVAEEVRALREQINAGKIGDLRLVYMNSSQEFPKYRPDFQTTYYARPEMGGGAILDAASHLIDLLIWIMGPPSHVGCMFDRLQLKGTKTEDTCLINIRFATGAMANITINQFQKPNTSRFDFIGSTGNLMLEHSRLSYANSDDPAAITTHDYMAGLDPMQTHQARFTMQANAMLDALDGAPCDLATLAEARDNLTVALAAKQSWRDKKIIEVSQ